MFSMGQDVRKESVYASFVEILDPGMNGCYVMSGDTL